MSRLVFVLVLVAACADAPTEAQKERALPTGESVTVENQAGGVTSTVTVTPSAPSIGDEMELVLRVEAEPGIELLMPDPDRLLGRFSIVRADPSSVPQKDGGRVEIRRYLLRPPMSGRQRIPRFRIEFVDGRSSSLDAGVTSAILELLTDEISIMVQSVLPEGGALATLRPGATEPLRTTSGSFLRRYWIPLSIALLLALVTAAVLIWRSRSRVQSQRSAYEIARTKLDTLAGAGLPDSERVDDWYVELSSIVRHYLENRFHLRAPELTTEEFLREARNLHELSIEHRSLLSSFLEGCDRVKFAGHLPGDTESSAAMESAARFIEETRLITEPAAEPSAQADGAAA